MKTPARPNRAPRTGDDAGDRGSRDLRAGARRYLAPIHLAGLVLLLMSGAAAAPLEAQEGFGEINREYTIKAAYLYNFGRYVRWPESSFAGPESPLVIGVLGPNPFGTTLELIAAEKRIDGRPIIVRNFESLAEYEPCHILFVVWSVGEETERNVVQRLSGAHVLLVGETPNFTQSGGVASFFVEENKIRFEINQEAAKREDLKISSKLLSLAKLVGEASPRYTSVADDQPYAGWPRR